MSLATGGPTRFLVHPQWSRLRLTRHSSVIAEQSPARAAPEGSSAAGIVSKNWVYDLSRADASQLIELLRDGLTPAAMSAPAKGEYHGLLDASTALSLLGHRVSVSAGSRDRTGDVIAIVLSTTDGTPALRFRADDATEFLMRVNAIVWTRVEA